jgi:hypothetical protein
MTLFQNLILFTNHYGMLQEMLEMASYLKYVDLYLTSEWGRFYVGHPVDYDAFLFGSLWVGLEEKSLPTLSANSIKSVDIASLQTWQMPKFPW